MPITINTPQELKDFGKRVSKHTKLSANQLLHAIALSQGYTHVRALFGSLENVLTAVHNNTPCWRCESKLRLDGYCTDDMCRHSDWPQEVTEQQYEIVSFGAYSHPLYDSTIALKRIPISAQVYVTDVFSDNKKFEVYMDVSEYFYDSLVNGTLAQVLFDMESCGFSGDWPSDKMVEFFSDRITSLFQLTSEDNGFECNVTKDDVIKWLYRYAPSRVNNDELLFKPKVTRPIV